jgi:hypothetical protein
VTDAEWDALTPEQKERLRKELRECLPPSFFTSRASKLQGVELERWALWNAQAVLQRAVKYVPVEDLSRPIDKLGEMSLEQKRIFEDVLVKELQKVAAEDGLSESTTALMIASVGGKAKQAIEETEAPVLSAGRKAKADHIRAGLAQKRPRAILDVLEAALRKKSTVKQFVEGIPGEPNALEVTVGDQLFLVYRDGEKVVQVNHRTGKVHEIGIRALEPYAAEIRKRLKPTTH